MFSVFIILIAGSKRKNSCKEMLMSRLCLTMVTSDPEAQLDKVSKLCKTATVCWQLDGCRSTRVKIQSHPICGLFCFTGADAASLLTGERYRDSGGDPGACRTIGFNQ